MGSMGPPIGPSMEVSKNFGHLFGSPCDKDRNKILGSIVGPRVFFLDSRATGSAMLAV